MADSKKPHFAKRSILKFFLPNWAGWVLWLVGLIDMYGIALVWFNIYGREAVQNELNNRQKQAKNAFFVFLDHESMEVSNRTNVKQPIL